MNNKQKTSRIIVAIAAFVLLVGCSVPQIKLPSALQTDTEMYTVKGRYGFS